MSRSHTRSLLDRARRLNRGSGPVFLSIIGDPDIPRLLVAMASNREAMIKNHYYVAAPDETTKAFHDDLRAIAHEQGAAIVLLGHVENAGYLERAMAADPTWNGPDGQGPLTPAERPRRRYDA